MSVFLVEDEAVAKLKFRDRLGYLFFTDGRP
jgi:hypothetical protein